jgi:hypothetical protein
MENRVSKGEKILERVSNEEDRGSFSSGFIIFPI